MQKQFYAHMQVTDHIYMCVWPGMMVTIAYMALDIPPDLQIKFSLNAHNAQMAVQYSQ